jgi:hypothetical protein
MAPPAMYRYQLARFRRGKARSRAPIIIGIRKLPSTEGIEGIRNSHTMITPWAVNSLL